ncbi:MAG: glycosyltransferase [Cyanobacteria bacterium Co-bin13]|nr:glycosyltransferase [Cyanobacteria bacterium Co-bin13]
MKPLRVLQIVPSISLIYGGPSQMVRGLSAALTRSGAEVTVLTTDSNGDSGQPPLDVPLNTPLSEDGYTVRYFRCAPFRRYKFSLGLLGWLAQNAQHYDIAHIHALFSPVSTAAATVSRWRNLPYLLRPLGTLDRADLTKKRRFKQIYGKLLERPNLAGAAAVHFTSPLEANVSHRFGAKTRDLVIPLGVNPPLDIAKDRAEAVCQQLGIPPDRPRLLYLSRLDPKKGLDLLIPALEQLVREGIEFHLVLAGSNPQDPAYERQVCDRITQSPLARHTTFTGFVTGEAKAALLKSADCFVLPSYYENFGIAVVEAMMAGLPVVISQGVYIWEGIAQSQSGWVCDLSTESLSAVLREALSSARLRQARGRNARQFAMENYGWDAIAQQTLAAYEQILNP